LQFNRQLDGNTVSEKIKQLPDLELILADGSTYNHKGRIETINGMVNPRTGSISYRAIFPNPDNLLRSGISGTVKMPSALNEVVMLPQKATFELQGKRFVYLLGNENKVQTKEVIVSNTTDTHFVIKEGLELGQQFVADGLIKLREGMEIIPQTSNAGSTGFAASSNE